MLHAGGLYRRLDRFNQSLTNTPATFTLSTILTQGADMTLSRWMFLFAMFFSLGWSGGSQAATKLTSASLAGTWQNEHGKKLTFRKNGTIIYQGKRYYYAVSSAGYIQLKGSHGDLTIPYKFVSGKLTLIEGGESSVYKRKR